MTGYDAGMRASVLGLPQPGAKVGAYVIERIAGSGGMAVVFAARHSGLDKRVALKMLLPHYAADPETARRFAREGAAAARLNHPHAVDVTDVGRDESGAPFLVMEYLEGEDLATLLEHEGKLDVERAVDIVIPVVAALAAAHELGIVHRDLKPQNIMLAQRRHELVPKVVDFGISKIFEDSVKLTGSKALLGTPLYMSPEQAAGARDVDARSDQFALGVVLYECLVGTTPFEASSLLAVLAAVVACKYTKPRELVATLPSKLEAVVVRALRKDPKARFASMRELGAALLPFASMRVQLAFAAEFDASLASAPTRSASVRVPKRASTLAQTATVARTWLRAKPRRVWSVAALSVLVALLGVALPVALIAMRNQEVAPRALVPEPKPIVQAAVVAPAVEAPVESLDEASLADAAVTLIEAPPLAPVVALPPTPAPPKSVPAARPRPPAPAVSTEKPPAARPVAGNNGALILR